MPVRPIEQAARLLTVETHLGRDVLIPTRFEGTEELSRPFSFRLGVISPQQKIAPGDLLGRSMSVLVRNVGGERRPFHGVVKSFTENGVGARGYRSYEIELVPWFWFLTRTADLRIFQNLTTVDIVNQVLAGERKTGQVKDVGFKREFDLSGVLGSFVKREYCVQYRESDFDFVSRLLEEDGIYYYFRHEPGRHLMVLANTPQGHFKCEEEPIRIRPDREIERHISEWGPNYEFRSGKWRLQDFNFKTPGDLSANRNTRLTIPALQPYEVYDYPGRYDQREQAMRLTSLRMQAHEVGHYVVQGASDCVPFAAGGRFDLDPRDVPGEFVEYVLAAVHHSAVDPTHEAQASLEVASYENRFSCISYQYPYRPDPITPKPFVRGPQTATVVGPSGEEIYTDEYGRVKVQFHWDREGQRDENSSCWVRVAQSWAGRQWGSIFTPRIGMEVVVDFLEADPDHPLIIGCVYNGDNKPPYTLPDKKTQSGIKTRSSLKGGTSDFNELRFEDKKGSEEVYFHAQKDFNRVVENDDSLDVGNNQTIKIKQDRTETITHGNESVTLKMGNRTHVLDMGNDALTLKMGNRTTKFNLGADSTEAMQQIELKVGQSSIVINQAGITIKGLMIQIEGQVLTKVEGKAMLVVKGGLTFIN